MNINIQTYIFQFNLFLLHIGYLISLYYQLFIVIILYIKKLWDLIYIKLKKNSFFTNLKQKKVKIMVIMEKIRFKVFKLLSKMDIYIYVKKYINMLCIYCTDIMIIIYNKYYYITKLLYDYFILLNIIFNINYINKIYHILNYI